MMRLRRRTILTRMELYEIASDLPAMRAPVLVMALDAWVDAGEAATKAAEHLARDGATVATFDTDALLDYRSRRPTLDIVDGEAASLGWAELTVRHARAGNLDLLVASGPEPDLRWKEFADSVVDIARRFGVSRSVALGAIPAAVPHTRPVAILATASPRDQLGPQDRVPEGLLRVPAAALSVVQMRLAEAGYPTIGFFAQIPHYVTAPFLAGAQALLERLARFLGVPLPLRPLPEDAATQLAELDETVAGRPDVAAYVQRLEEMVPGAGLTPGESIPSADEIAAEVEKYLRGRE